MSRVERNIIRVFWLHRKHWTAVAYTRAMILHILCPILSSHQTIMYCTRKSDCSLTSQYNRHKRRIRKSCQSLPDAENFKSSWENSFTSLPNILVLSSCWILIIGGKSIQFEFTFCFSLIMISRVSISRILVVSTFSVFCFGSYINAQNIISSKQKG